MGKEESLMAKADEIKKAMETLVKRAKERNYLDRKMSLVVETKTGSDGIIEALGTLTLSVSENPSVPESWVVVPFTVKMFSKDSVEAVNGVMSNVNAIPIEWGDAIFEPTFFEVLLGKLPSVEDGPEAEKVH